MQVFKKICLGLLIIGGLNWGLVGLLDFNLVDSIFGAGSTLSSIVYIIVGICSLISISILFTDFKEEI